MSWQPPGGQPDGWQPPGWDVEDTSGSTPVPQRTRYGARRGALRRYFNVRRAALNSESQHIYDAIVKDPASTHSVELDLYILIANEWQPNREFTIGTLVRPLHPNGFELVAMTDGVTNSDEPRVPGAVGEIFKDGSITWQVAQPSTASLLAVGTPTAASEPLGLTISGLAVVNNRYLQATYSGGTVENDYDVVFSIDIGGQPKVFRQTVQVREQ